MIHVELKFPVTGTTVPADHGYALYGALSRLLPDIHTNNGHEADWLAIETLPGTTRGDGTTQLDPRATLRMRLPQDRVALVLSLAGKRLELDGHALRLGAPQINLLAPAPQLYARIVTIKGFTEPEPFQQAVCRKLDELGIQGEPTIGPRRILRVGTHTVVGFALGIHELSDEASLLLQEKGLGGRRKMGGGFFHPVAVDRVLGEKPSRRQEVKRGE